MTQPSSSFLDHSCFMIIELLLPYLSIPDTVNFTETCKFFRYYILKQFFLSKQLNNSTYHSKLVFKYQCSTCDSVKWPCFCKFARNSNKDEIFSTLKNKKISVSPKYKGCLGY